MNDYIKTIQHCENEMTRLSDTCDKEDESVRTLQKIYRDKLSVLETALKENASR